MVKEVTIENYKSVQDLNLELGRINVLIGANGCGKSNILEAIALGSAAAEHKLSNEVLSSRGIRVTDPEWMRSGFSHTMATENISIQFKINKDQIQIELSNDNAIFSEWRSAIHNKALLKSFDRNEFLELYESFIRTDSHPQTKSLLEALRAEQIARLDEQEPLKKFLIYAPENSFLRKFEEETQIEPLGIKGEGLFKLLSVMSKETPDEFNEIIENLELIDWFEGFEIPNNLVFTEKKIRIKDRFLEEGLQYFDQRSSNEGFLFLLFYFALFISKYTPKFFAIDNIDTSLNPKMCIELIKIVTKLAKKHDKQVIFTTHNPAILDGLNLTDEEVRLFVVSRNKDGHTKTKRIFPTSTPEGEIPVRLSEKFMRGYIGGLPKNF